MKRRTFLRASLAASAAVEAMIEPPRALSQSNPPCSEAQFEEVAGITRYVSEFVVNTKFADVPEDVLEVGKKSILDGLGLALAGSRSTAAQVSRTYFHSLASSGGASVLGTSLKTAPRFAAFANGIAIHVDDFDDTQLALAKDRVYGLLVHPTVPVLPAVLAWAEANPTNGEQFLTAYHVGVEVECKIAEAISPRHYENGFHSTGTCGAFGSAAASAKLRGFDGMTTGQALAIAGSQAAGLRDNFGSMTKSFQAGHAAEAGVVAADFAANKWTASERILEAPSGFFHAYGGSYDSSVILGKLGKPWTFSSPGVSIKPFPSGSLTHPAMTELLRLIRSNAIKAEEVQQVEVGTNHNMPTALIHHRPKTALEAKFSMEFCLAILLIENKAGLAEFHDAVVNRPDVQDMIGRVRFYVDPQAESAGYDKMTSIIKVHLKDGRVIQGRADFAKGSPSDPMSYDDVAEKFRQCAIVANWQVEKSTKIVELCRNLEKLTDGRDLIALCARKD